MGPNLQRHHMLRRLNELRSEPIPAEALAPAPRWAPPVPPDRQGDVDICVAEDCDQPRVDLELCRKHWIQSRCRYWVAWQARGPRTPQGGCCTESGCGADAFRYGLRPDHLEQAHFFVNEARKQLRERNAA